MDARLSIPPVEEIPCMFTVCFFTVVYKGQNVMQFFKSLGELDAMVAGGEGAGGAVPTTNNA